MLSEVILLKKKNPKRKSQNETNTSNQYELIDSRNNIFKDAKHGTAFENFKLCEEASKQDIR